MTITKPRYLYRVSPTELEVRSNGDGRTIYGLAVPFNTKTRVHERGRTYTETIRPGSFTRTLNERGAAKVKFRVQHDNETLPIGRAVSLVEDPAGLVGEFRVSETTKGDEVLELVRDGVLDGLSIGFRPIRDRWSNDRGSVERVEVALHEVSVVETPAYAAAAITGVRSGINIASGVARRRLDIYERKW